MNEVYEARIVPSLPHYHLNIKKATDEIRAGKIAHQLRAMYVLIEDLGLVTTWW